MKFRENPSNGSRVIPYGRTDIHGKTYSRFSHFANSPKNIQHDVGQHRSLELISPQNA